MHHVRFVVTLLVAGLMSIHARMVQCEALIPGVLKAEG